MLNDSNHLLIDEAARIGYQWILDPSHRDNVRITMQWALNHFDPGKQLENEDGKVTRYHWIAHFLWKCVHEGLSLDQVMKKAKTALESSTAIY